jgi:ubiquinone/menaquinone biosynthesis C-methylase UbiE
MSVLSTVAPWDLVAEGYSETTMKFFQGYIDTALELVPLRSDDVIADIACGPGTLALAAAERAASVKAVDFSENMISMLRKGMADRGVTNIEPYEGDGQHLPYGDETFDAAFSIFGLMFFPERAKGYAEIFRTLKSGGRVCISSWAPVDRSSMMETMFGALKAIQPDLPSPTTNMESLENPDLLRSELSAAGFGDVEVHGVTKSMPVASAEEFWESMVKGSAPVTMMKNSMPEDVWREKCEIAVDNVENAVGSFPASLSSDAWFGVGVK